MSNKKIAQFGLLIALAFLFSYIESLLPNPTSIIGMKIGFANIVVVVALYLFGTKEAITLSMIRIILVSFTYGNLYSLLYSIAGAVLSLLTMYLLKRWKKFSIIGVSCGGGVMHNIGQIIVAMIVIDTINLIYIVPILIIAGVIAGIFIGVIGAYITKRMKITSVE
ncbi:MAG TPA: Gx transporter family protein [Lachnospiraceae bacterium]|nr:Gx transporter family protein [Lachnospiraceae bacterium]